MSQRLGRMSFGGSGNKRHTVGGDNGNGASTFQTPLMPMGSGIPVPASGNPRYSLAGSGSRQSLGPARVARPSMSGSSSAIANGMQASQSALPINEFAGMSLNAGGLGGNFDTKPSLTGRASLSSTLQPAANEGRTSTSGRASNVFGKQSLGTAGGVLSLAAGGKDPRPIREKTYQYNCIKTLINFLAKAGYDKPISQKILTAPSSKDFQHIFKFLYAQLDPTFEFGKKFEEEVPAAMKGLRYPYAGDISKSSLYAVGSMHAWPSLLAMLTWMVELIMCCDEMNSHLDVDIMPSAADSAVNQDKVFFDYLTKSYKVFLAGGDNYESMLTELSASFERKNEAVLGELDQLGREVAALDEENQVLTNEEPPLAKAEREKVTYTSDIEKFKKFIAHLDVKKQKFVEAIEKFQEELEAAEREQNDAELQRASLQAQVDAQDICPEDIDRMNADKEQLVKSMESLGQAKEEASKIFWEREVQVQKKMDAVEKLVQEYNFTGERIGVIPVEAQNSGRVDFELMFNPHATKLDGMLNLDVREHIQASLLRLREACQSMIHQAQDHLIALKETLDRSSESYADKVEELKQVEEKVRKLTVQYTEDKDTFTAENKKSMDEVEQLEQTLQKMRTDMSSNFLFSQQTLQRITIQYDQTVSKTTEEKERIGKEIFRILEELINFKTQIESSLADLELQFSKELTALQVGN